MSNKLRIMLVDDEPNLLNGLARQLRSTIPVETFHQPKEALRQILTPIPCAVVVSDMRMPEMNGIDFLSAVQRTSPDTVRIMLTGNADQETVAKAVNESNIFRFLVKPCSPLDLIKAISDGADQYRLVTGEKELLQRTLAGAVKLLTDTLALARPALFSGVLEKREIVRALCKTLQISNTWEIELAVMLAPIGAITLPPELLEADKRSLKPNQLEALAGIPLTSKRLITNIPRLERVAELIERTGTAKGNRLHEPDGTPDRTTQILHAVSSLPRAALSQPEIQQTIGDLRSVGIDVRITQELEKILLERAPLAQPSTSIKTYSIRSSELCAGQRLMSDISTTEGKLLITAGNILTETLVERIRGYAGLVGLKEPILVDAMIPTLES